MTITTKIRKQINLMYETLEDISLSAKESMELLEKINDVAEIFTDSYEMDTAECYEDFKEIPRRDLCAFLNIVTQSICDMIGLDNNINWVEAARKNHSLEKCRMAQSFMRIYDRAYEFTWEIPGEVLPARAYKWAISDIIDSLQVATWRVWKEQAA